VRSRPSPGCKPRLSTAAQAAPHRRQDHHQNVPVSESQQTYTTFVQHYHHTMIIPEDKDELLALDNARSVTASSVSSVTASPLPSKVRSATRHLLAF
jgi:hypothetical protein